MTTRPTAAEEASRLAETVSPDVRGGWALRAVTVARRGPDLRSHLMIAALLGIILCICLRTGIVPMRSYVSDVMYFAENGWRVLWGQRPHVDYSSGLGPVSFLLAALGLKLAGGSLDGLGYGSAVAAMAIGIWAYALLARRVSGLPAVAGAAMLCLLAVAPLQTGESYWLSTIAMRHNRQGYALLGLLIVESFPMRPQGPARGIGGALSTGVLCAILLFLKANYFLVSLVLAAISVVWSGRLERASGAASPGRTGGGLRRRRDCVFSLSALRRGRHAGGFAHGGRCTRRGDFTEACPSSACRELSRLPHSGRVGRADSSSGNSAGVRRLGGTPPAISALGAGRHRLLCRRAADKVELPD